MRAIWIKTIGLFRNKAKNVIGPSERLVAEHGGQVPRTREASKRPASAGKLLTSCSISPSPNPTTSPSTRISSHRQPYGLGTR
jgi:endonuclease-3